MRQARVESDATRHGVMQSTARRCTNSKTEHVSKFASVTDAVSSQLRTANPADIKDFQDDPLAAWRSSSTPHDGGGGSILDIC